MILPAGRGRKAGKFAGTPIAPAPDYAKLAQAYGGYGEKVCFAARACRPRSNAGPRASGEGRLAHFT